MADLSFSECTVLIPGPSFHIDLAPLDARHPVHYSRRLLIFRCASAAQRDVQLAAFKAGLKALVSRCPILGGFVTPLPADEAKDGFEDWRTIIPERGIELTVKDLQTKLPSFMKLEAAQFPASHLPFDLLMPIPQNLGNDRQFAACKVQFSAIDGGTILTLAISHSVADGAGMNELVRVLSEETRLAQGYSKGDVVKEANTMAAGTTIGMDRRVLRNITSKLAFDIQDHPAYTWERAPSANTTPHPFEATTPEITVPLRISAASLTRLKADATTPGAPPISTHDAICALIWRSVILIRSRRSASPLAIPPSTTVNLFMPSDGRRHLDLPASYIGNAVYQLIATLDLGTIISPSGLQHAASAVRRAITSVNPDHLASYMAMLKEKWVGWQFMLSYSTTGVAMGTDWKSGMLYNLDWGEAFGPMASYRHPSAPGEDFNCVMPKLPDGGAEVLVAVLPQEVEILKGAEGFGNYI
jgi:hypothetical protein